MIIEGRSGWRLEVGAGGGLFDVRGWLGCVDAPGVGVIPEVDKCKLCLLSCTERYGSG